MNHPSALIRYREEDRELLSVEELSSRGRMSRAFIRLCLSTGCPSYRGRLSQAMLLDWLFQFYPKVREAAGLPELPPHGEISQAAIARLQMGEAMITLLEYAEVRSSRPEEQQHLRRVRMCLESTLDRA